MPSPLQFFQYHLEVPFLLRLLHLQTVHLRCAAFFACSFTGFLQPLGSRPSSKLNSLTSKHVVISKLESKGTF